MRKLPFNYSFSLITSFLLHLVFLLNINLFKSHTILIKKENVRKEIKLKIKKSALPSKSKIAQYPSSSNHSLKKKKRGLQFSQLGIKGPVQQLSRNAQVGKVSGSKNINLYHQINQYYSYPQAFSKNGIEGFAHVSLILNKNGFKQMKIITHNPFLRVNIARVIEKSLHTNYLKQNFSLKFVHIDMIFQMELTTNLSKKPETLDKELYFYRKSYGGDSGTEKVAKGVTKTLSYVANFLVLLQHRPDFLRSQKELMSRLLKNQKWRKFKEHYFFNHEKKNYK